jgi:hypothetical protein
MATRRSAASLIGSTNSIGNSSSVSATGMSISGTWRVSLCVVGPPGFGCQSHVVMGYPVRVISRSDVELGVQRSALASRH